MTMDFKFFYLNTPLKRYECLQLKLVDILQDVAKQNKLATKASEDGWVYVEIIKGMHGLPHAGLLA